MTQRTKALLLGCVVLGSVAASLQAQSDVPVPLAISGTVTFQKEDTGSDTSPITKHNVGTAKFTTGTILSLISTNLQQTFPKGSTLVLTGPSFFVQSKGNDSIDVSSFFSLDLGDTSITSGSDNSDTGQFSYSSTLYATLSFDDGNGIVFSVRGLAKVSSSDGPNTNSNGDPLAHTQSLSIKGFTGAGEGTVFETSAIFSASISGSGKIKITPE